MKSNPQFTFLLLALILVSACQSSQQRELEQLKQEVMQVHDEVMPKMGDLRKTEKALRTLADEKMLNSASQQAVACTEAADEVAAANEAMMEWMRAYDPDFEGSDQEIKTYLETQKKKIEQVRSDILSSLEQGKDLLSN